MIILNGPKDTERAIDNGPEAASEEAPKSEQKEEEK